MTIVPTWKHQQYGSQCIPVTSEFRSTWQQRSSTSLFIVDPSEKIVDPSQKYSKRTTIRLINMINKTIKMTSTKLSISQFGYSFPLSFAGPKGLGDISSSRSSTFRESGPSNPKKIWVKFAYLHVCTGETDTSLKAPKNLNSFVPSVFFILACCAVQWFATAKCIVEKHNARVAKTTRWVSWYRVNPVNTLQRWGISRCFFSSFETVL